ncbi:MAG: hypothetical protein ACR2QW_14265 [bacterium]
MQPRQSLAADTAKTMRILSTLTFIVTVLYAYVAVGSQIAPKSLVDIADDSAIVVVGVVEQVVRISSSSTDGDRFVAYVRIVSYLKGQSTAAAFELPLHVGGLRGFDTALSEGDQAVFFLRSIDAGRAKLHAWGSVARLPAGYYYVD